MPRPVKPHWHKSRHRWYANIGEPDEHGRRREVFAPVELGLGPKDEDRAWEWLRAERARRASAEAPVDASAVTVAGLAELYLAWAETRTAEDKLSQGHYENKGYHLSRLAAELGDREARTITPRDVDAFIVSLQREGLSATYIDNICATVSALFNWGAKSGHFAASPIKGFEAPAVPDSPERFAERHEIAAWLRFSWRRSKPGSVASRYDRLTVLLQRALVHSGARPGEMCVLLWSDIKWSGWTSSAGHACARAVIDPKRWKSGRKTGKPRTIYFSPTLTRALRREFGRPDRHPHSVFTHGRGRGGKGAGEPWPSSSILAKKIRSIRREAIAAGLPIEDEGPNRVTNYRYRHTAISSLLMMGVDVPTVAELTGTSPEMIYKTYGHLLDKHLQEAAEKLTKGRK